MTVRPVILAAGLGKRMRSETAKVLHPLLGRPLLAHVLGAVSSAGLDRPVVVVGHQAEAIEAAFADRAAFARQERPTGTADAVRSALPKIGEGERVLVLCGDTPLVRPDTLRRFVETAAGARAAILTAVQPDPRGYGRIVRSPVGAFSRIVEDRDCDASERGITEVNTGVYLADVGDIARLIGRIGSDNANGEAYLPDLFGLLAGEGAEVALVPSDPEETMGVNDRRQLAAAGGILRRRILDGWMEAGVTVVDPESTWIEADVAIAPDVEILPQTMLLGRTRIERGAVIGPASEVVDSEIGAGSRVWRSVVEASRLAEDVRVGPFAHLRPGCDVGAGVEVGNYAELKNARVGPGTKCHHHSYLGDAVLGRDVNVGAGAITVNYDGRTKQTTTVGDRAFIGCNVNLIAPVTIGEGAYVAAGSTVTKDAPPSSLAIARERQRNIEGWVDRRRGKEE